MVALSNSVMCLFILQASSLWSEYPSVEWIRVCDVRKWTNCYQCTCGFQHHTSVRSTAPQGTEILFVHGDHLLFVSVIIWKISALKMYNFYIL